LLTDTAELTDDRLSPDKQVPPPSVWPESIAPCLKATTIRHDDLPAAM